MLAGLPDRHKDYTIGVCYKDLLGYWRKLSSFKSYNPEEVIQKIDHTDAALAQQLYELFQASYAVEAKLLGAVDFPPLKRKVDSFMASHNVFYGYFVGNALAAATEIDQGSEATHIQSLVVHPKFFRQGLGAALVNFVLETYSAKVFTVETGAANGPATQLYRKLGFRELFEYDTDHGVRKVRFEKVIDS